MPSFAIQPRTLKCSRHRGQLYRLLGPMGLIAVQLFVCSSLQARSAEVIQATQSYPKPWLTVAQQQWQFTPLGEATNRQRQIAVMKSCRGRIDWNFVYENTAWEQPSYRRSYYTAVHRLIDEVGTLLIQDYADTFGGNAERATFVEALKALAWQESGWMHYIVNAKSQLHIMKAERTMNALGDWGITQIARSSFDRNHRLNTNFFESQGYCSISASLYYGFMEYLMVYRAAKKASCNSSVDEQILGAYNRYSSGFSDCHDGFAKTDKPFRRYQRKALSNFARAQRDKPWLGKMWKVDTQEVQRRDGAIIRGPRHRPHIALLFSADQKAQGTDIVSRSSRQLGFKAAFFLTGRFLQTKKGQQHARRLHHQGHLLGAHSDQHLAMVEWPSKKLLIRRPVFLTDLGANLKKLDAITAASDRADYWLPPFETWNVDIVRWTRRNFELDTLGFSPGIRTHADYIGPGETGYRSAAQLMNSLFAQHRRDPYGLNGYLIFMHLNVSDKRKLADRLYTLLPQMVERLHTLGYRLVRVDRLVENRGYGALQRITHAP